MSGPAADTGGEYGAKAGYLDADEVARYEHQRFGGLLGRHRWRREQRGVGAMVARLPAGIELLDCPCGTGRWWPVLATRAARIEAADVSPAMLAAARKRAGASTVPVSVREADAERLPYDDGSFDAVFSHALTKHLPIPTQQRVLAEFARVSREWIVCSFSLVNHLTYEAWRRRDLGESYPLLPEQLGQLAEAAGLEVAGRRRCTTRLGVEHSVLLRKRG